jgi:hypothetical protein
MKGVEASSPASAVKVSFRTNIARQFSSSINNFIVTLSDRRRYKAGDIHFGLKMVLSAPGIGRFVINPFLRSRKTCIHCVIIGLEHLIHGESDEYILTAFTVVNE